MNRYSDKRPRAIQQGPDEYVCPKCSARAGTLDRISKHYRDWHLGGSDYSPFAHQYIGPFASESVVDDLLEMQKRQDGRGLLARVFRTKFKRDEAHGVRRFRERGLSRREIAEGVYAQRLLDRNEDDDL